MKRFIAFLLFSLSFGAFAGDATLLRTGVTRAELEKSIGTGLVEDKTSTFKNGFEPKDFPHSLRNKLPAAFSSLEFKHATFHFDNSGRLWRARFQADMTAEKAFKVYVDTSTALDNDKNLKFISEYSHGTKIDWKIEPVTECPDVPPDNATSKILRAKWKAYSQAERQAISMSCNERGPIENEYVTKAYLWNKVSFEPSEFWDDSASLNSALAQPIRASVVFSVIQTTKDRPDIVDTESVMMHGARTLPVRRE